MWLDSYASFKPKESNILSNISFLNFSDYCHQDSNETELFVFLYAKSSVNSVEAPRTSPIRSWAPERQGLRFSYPAVPST